MAPDSEDKDPLDEQETKQREEYLKNPAAWLQAYFHSGEEQIADQIVESGEWQRDQMKNFMQDAAELHVKGLRSLRTSLITWLGIIAVIVLASGGFWIGAIGVSAVIGCAYWRNWFVEKSISHLDSFRDKFRTLLKEIDDVRSGMLTEDKSFLQECKDSVLFPLVIADHRRKEVDGSDLRQIETLYLEYCSGSAHYHGSASLREDCKLCESRQRVREHIESVLSKFEVDVGSARETLITTIDSNNNEEGAIRVKDFLKEFLWWKENFPGDYPRSRHDRNFLEDRWRHSERCEMLYKAEGGSFSRFVGGEDSKEKRRPFLLKSLRDKERWTFVEADTVRELCTWDKGRIRWDLDDLSEVIYDKLTSEMESAAKLCGLEEKWKRYDQQRQFLRKNQRALMDVRRAIGRHNPEAMFRELCYPDGRYGGLLWKHSRLLENFINYGYDSKIVDREIKTARKLIAKEHGRWRSSKALT